MLGHDHMVIPALDPGIHAFGFVDGQVDPRIKSGTAMTNGKSNAGVALILGRAAPAGQEIGVVALRQLQCLA